jgi:hypothetical protein
MNVVSAGTTTIAARPSRDEHLQWCKDRALQYVRQGDMAQAFASMGSDLGKHEETRNHSGLEVGLMLMLGGHLNSAHEMERFINGFN